MPYLTVMIIVLSYDGKMIWILSDVMTCLRAPDDMDNGSMLAGILSKFEKTH